MRWEQQVQYSSVSDVGVRRRNNEDACVIRISKSEEEFRRRGHLFVVADGMGGHAVGELASKLAIETLPHTFFKSKMEDVGEALRAAVEAANAAIHTRGSQNRDFLRMGTTCTALNLGEHGVYIAHVGDRRAYRIRRDRIDQLTFDHSLEWELERSGRKAELAPTARNNRNVITRSLGPEPIVDLDLEGPHPVFPDDVFVLCSDGLINHVSDEEIATIAQDLAPRSACRLLVQLANLRGGTDNCTVVIARACELPANVPPAAPPLHKKSDGELGWLWLIAFWVVATFFAAGVSLLLFQYWVIGTVLTVLFGSALVTLGAAAMRQHRTSRATEEDSVTTHWRPYRTAVAQSSSDLVRKIAHLEVELRRAAQEDGWSIDWEEHRTALESATQALRQRRYARALQEYAKVINLFMKKGARVRRPASPPAGAVGNNSSDS
ncbi:MAG: protein phosphatase 2C domain-containing protein [Maioricimonas sp. JB049]